MSEVQRGLPSEERHDRPVECRWLRRLEGEIAMMTEVKLLSECGTMLVVDDNPADRYQVEIEQGDFLVIRTGATAGKAAFHFDHPNLAAKAKAVFEFKHYRRNGGKFWTSRAGMEFYLVIPRTAITMLPEKGHSYVPAMINGVKVKFNVSGGTINGWTDWMHTHTEISVNHPVRDLKKLAEVAVRGSVMEPVATKALEPDREAQWSRLAARVAKGLIEKVAKLAEEGKNPIVKLLAGYNVKEGVLIEVSRRAKKIEIPPKEGYLRSYRIEHTGAVRNLILDVDGHWGKTRVKLNQIDWAATAAANGIAA